MGVKAIVVDNVTFTYRGSTKPAIADINLVVEEGEFLLIVGSTGSGKSTLIKTFNGLIPHFYQGEFKGDVIVYGMNTREHKVYELSTVVGMVFQDPENQLLTLTVENEVAFGPENLGLPRDEIRRRVEAGLKALNIAHLRYRVPFELSGGEQQKVAVASVLAMRPKVLVLDEPTSNMDPLSALEFMLLLKRLNEEGTTVVVVEHRVDMVAPLASRVIVMNKGRIVDEGDPREVFSRDKVYEAGVSTPKVSLIARLLEREGLSLNIMPLTVEELVSELAEVIKR